MTAVFETILSMSANAALVIAAVLLIRLLLRRAPKKYSYLLWSAVAFRLACPVSFRSAFSLLRVKELLPTAEKAAETVTEGYFLSVPPEHLEPIVPTDGMVFYEYPLANPAPAAEPSLMTVLAAVWCVGVILMLLYAAVSVLLLHRRMNSAVHLEENVWQSDRLRSPFILGVFRPRIYIPFGLEERSLAYVLEHERCHLRRLDHLIRPLAFLLLALHWFNPLCWLAFFLMSRDMEMSCDEAVLRRRSDPDQTYSYTLLSFAVNRRLPLPTPLAFSESGTKQRIQNVLRWKKPRLWVSIAAVVLTLTVLVACAANPKTGESPYSWTSSVTVEDVTDGDFALWSREIPYHIAMSEEQIAELVAALNAIPEKELTTGRGTPSLMTAYLACGEREYLLRYGGGITELAFDPDTAEQFGKGVIWQTSNEGLAAFMETLLAQEAPGCMLRSGEDYTAAKWFPDGQFDFDYDGVNTLEAAPGGTLIFDTDFTADSLTVGEDYYRKISANATRIEQESYTLEPNADGDFELTLPLGREGEKLIYYILYGEGKFVVRVRLSGEAVLSEPEELPVFTCTLPDYSGSTELDERLWALLEQSQSIQETRYIPILTCNQRGEVQLWRMGVLDADSPTSPVYTSYILDPQGLFTAMNLSGWETIFEGSMDAYIDQEGEALLDEEMIYTMTFSTGDLRLSFLSCADVCGYWIVDRETGRPTESGVASIPAGTAKEILKFCGIRGKF